MMASITIRAMNMNMNLLSRKLNIKPPPQSGFCVKRSRPRVAVVVAAAAKGGKKQLAEEMRMAAMKLHKIGKSSEKEAAGFAIAKWEPSLEGYLKFLVDTKLIYEALETIVDKAVFPQYAGLRKSGLERTEKLRKDLEWFEEEGHCIPEASNVGMEYAKYLNELSEKDPHAFICHFYMTYFGHSAGGRIIGRKVEEKLLEGKELEFYKYEGELPHLLQNVRDKLNAIGEGWSKEEKERCLEEIERSFNYGGDILRLVLF